MEMIDLKVYQFVSCFLSLIFICNILSCCSKDDSPYPNGGRDTHEQFGDRRFVILRMGNLNTSKDSYSLYDRKKAEQIEGKITNYKEIPPYVYTIGKGGPGEIYYVTQGEKTSDSIYYTRVNYETGEVIQHLDKQLFSEKDIEVFEKLENTAVN